MVRNHQQGIGVPSEEKKHAKGEKNTNKGDI